MALWAGAAAPCAAARNGLRSLTLSQGLSDLLVNVIYKDSTGFVWFGTESSLDRFDGNNIVRHPVEGDSRRSRRVLSIAEGPGGLIYAGTRQGLFALKKNDAELSRLFPDKIDCTVGALLNVGKSSLFVGTRHGLFVYDPLTDRLQQRLFVADAMSEENDIIGLAAYGNYILALTPGRLWMVQKDGIPGNSFPLPAHARASCLVTYRSTVYIGTEGDGVITLNPDSGAFGSTFHPGNGVVTDLSVTKAGNLMVATDGEGIYFYSIPEGRLLHNLTTASDSRRQLRTNSVYSTLSDSEGRLWIGYYQGGVDFTPFDDGIVDVFRTPLPGDFAELSVRAFAVDDAREIALIGTPEGALLIDRSGSTIRRYNKPELASNLVFTAAYRNGKFYFGTYHGGMYALDAASGTVNRFGPAELDQASVFKIEFDPQGNLWAGTSEGLYRFEGVNPMRFTHFSSFNSQLPQGNVYEIFFDSTGRGWICTENGVAVWNGSHLRSSGFPSGFINGMKIRVVYEDSAHNLYFAPDRGEVWKSDLSLQNFEPLAIGVPGRFSQFTSILEDANGFLWLATDKGLVRYARDGRYTIVNNAAGKVNPVYTLATPLRDSDGTLWMGSTTGLHHIYPQVADSTASALRHFSLGFTSIFSNKQPITERIADKDGRLSITLGQKENDITVNVADFSFRYLDFVEFEYMLEGVDSEWRFTDGAHPIEYRDLEPGSYTLRVREAGNPDSEISLLIDKQSENMPWIWAAVAIVGLGLLLAATLILLSRRRERQEMSQIAGSALPASEGAAQASAPEESPRRAAYSTTRLSDEECRRLFRKLDALMKAEKPYVNPDLKSRDLAEMIGTSTHALSFLFNQYLHKSYYDYVNEYRVEEFKRRVKNSDLSKFTLTTLAERCGFSSRASFFRHFKALTGQTPSEYLKENDA